MATAADRAKVAAARRPPSPSGLFRRYRKSQVPEGGWDAKSFEEGGEQLLQDISNVISMAKMRGTRSLSDDLFQLMQLQFLEVINSAVAIYGRSYGNLEAPVTEQGPGKNYLLALWLLAIEQSLQTSSMQVALVTTPVIQSVVQDVYIKVMTLLGANPNKVQVTLMTNRARSIAQSLESITQTTNDKMSSVIENSVLAGASMLAIVDSLRAKMASILSTRVNTILRTEIGRAADEAAMSAYTDSKAVSHVSVVGCQAIEAGIPSFAGVPTCNIQNVPVAQARRLRFHPNHTGIIVPSAFYNRDGTLPKLIVSRGRG
jgi:hypothetical protein